MRFITFNAGNQLLYWQLCRESLLDYYYLLLLLYLYLTYTFIIMQGINYIGSSGQNTDTRYPYSSASGTTGTCQAGLINFPPGGGVQISGTAKLITPQNDEIALMKAVAIAPTTVYFDVEMSFMSYA